MYFTLWLLALTFGILDSGTGIILNALIVILCAKNIRKGFPMNKCDQVHLIMGLVNILLQCLMTTQATLWVVVLQSFVKEIFLPLFFINLFLIYYSYWLTSWLCLVYCVSIASYTHRLFVWLKRRIPALLPHLLMLSIAGSLIISIPVFWVCLDPEEGGIGNATGEYVDISRTFKLGLFYVIPAIIFGCCLPFGLTFISIILTIIPLIHHMQNMKQNDLDLGQSKLQAHARAVKTMVMHLMLVLSFYIANMLCFTIEDITVNAKTLVGFFCMLSYPAAQSAIIIHSNSKLKSALVELFCLKNLCNRLTQDLGTERVKAELQASG